MELLFEILSLHTGISEECKNAVQKTVKVKDIPKGNLLIQEGDSCQKLYFIQKGCLRGFYYRRTINITNWIYTEGMFIPNTFFFMQIPSHEAVEAIEDSQLFYITLSDFQNLQIQFPEVLQLRILITQMYFMKLQESLLMIRMQSTHERYRNFLEKEGHLLNRVPLHYIASYLGMTPISLSRIRGQI